MTRAPSTRTFTSSCSTPWWAEYPSWHRPARTPGILFAATEAPTPLPHRRMPAIGPALADGHPQLLGEVRVVHRSLGARAQVRHLVAEGADDLQEVLLQGVAGVVGGERDSHGLTSLLPELLLRRRHHVVGGEAEVLEQVLERRRGPEAPHPQDLPGPPHVGLPAEHRRLLHGDAGGHRGGEHRLAVLGRLLLEQLPAGHADRPGADALGLELLVRLDDEPHLAPGGHQQHLGLATLGVGQHVGALSHSRSRDRPSSGRTWGAPAG